MPPDAAESAKSAFISSYCGRFSDFSARAPLRPDSTGRITTGIEVERNVEDLMNGVSAPAAPTGGKAPAQELESVTIRFCGDSGDGMQLAGTQFYQRLRSAR